MICGNCPYFQKRYDDGFEISGSCTNKDSSNFNKTVYVEPYEDGCETNKTIEIRLKELIEEEYSSIRKFCLLIDLAPTTMYSIFQRGIASANLKAIKKICDELELSIDGLVNNQLNKR